MYPAVGNDIADCFEFCLVLYLQLVYEKSDCHKIAIRQVQRDIAYILGNNASHAGDKILYRHCGEENIARVGLFAVLFHGCDALYIMPVGVYFHNAGIHDYFAAERTDFICHFFIELTGTFFVIGKFFYLLFFHLAVFLFEWLGKRGPYRFHE